MTVHESQRHSLDLLRGKLDFSSFGGLEAAYQVSAPEEGTTFSDAPGTGRPRRGFADPRDK